MTQFKLILRTRFTFQQRRTGTNEKSNERSRSIETDLGGKKIKTVTTKARQPKETVM